MGTTRKTISAHERALKDVFCDDFSFEIPGYQRPYAWTTEHAKILVDDLLTHLEDQPDDLKGANPYFLGSVVLIKGDDPRAEVVDGQQRLTTLTILFSVLRSLREKRLPDLERGSTFGRWILQLGNPDLMTEDKPRLQLRSQDQHYFNEHIQEAGGLAKFSTNIAKLSDSQANIRENAQVIYEMLDAEDDTVLTRLCQFLLGNCYLVIVTTPDIDSAFRIFSVLNDRGLDLDTADIIKSQVIGSLEKSKQKRYIQVWEDLEESLGREEFGNLFTHIRMVIRRRKLKQALLKEYKEYIKPDVNPKAFVEKYLVPYAKSYSRILYDGFRDFKLPECPEPDKHLQWLKRVDNADWIPTALFYMSKNEGNPKKVLRFFEKLERLASIMMILRYDINQRLNRYAEVFTAIDDDREFDEEAALALTETEKMDARKCLDGPVYQTVRTRMPILLRLDSVLSDGMAIYNHPRISIEHVMPQTPAVSSDWSKMCPNEEEYQELVHKLGNLVLLSRNKNSSASNYDFDTKKESYFKKGGHSAFILTNQVLDEEVWTPEVIRKRQGVLVEKLVAEWDL